MKKIYNNPTIEVMHISAMQALCESEVPQPGNPGGLAPARKDVF